MKNLLKEMLKSDAKKGKNSRIKTRMIVRLKKINSEKELKRKGERIE